MEGQVNEGLARRFSVKEGLLQAPHRPRDLTHSLISSKSPQKAYRKPHESVTASGGDSIKKVQSSTFKLPLQNKFTLLEERSNQEGRNSPINNEDYLICLFLNKKYNFNLNPKKLASYINFDMVCKNDLLAFIKNYFYVQHCELLNKEYNFNFNLSYIGEYFHYNLISEKEMFDFVYSIVKKKISMSNVSYKGNNKKP